MNVMGIDANLKRNYDTYYEDGQSEWRRLGAVDKARNIVAACQACPHDTVLDIGAGEGAVIQELAQSGFAREFYAVEVSQSGVRAIHNRKVETLKEVRLFDGYSIPYGDDSFDLAILTHVIEHVEHPRRLLQEAGRVARHVFVEVPLEDRWRAPVDFRPTRTGHINFYSYKNIRKLLQTCRFDVVLQETTNPSYAVHKYQSGRKAPLLYVVRETALRVAPALARAFFVYHNHCLARRQDRTATAE